MKRVAWFVMLCVALWGQMDYLPSLAAPQPPAPVRFLAHSDHSPDCRCAQCPGGKRCCCRPATTPALACLLKARCDTPSPVSFAAKINPPLPPRLIEVSLVWTPVPASRVAAFNQTLSSFAPAPPTSPPRFA